MAGKKVRAQIVEMGETGIPVFTIGEMAGVALQEIEPRRLLVCDPKTRMAIPDSVARSFTIEKASHLGNFSRRKGARVFYGEARNYAGAIVLLTNGVMVAEFSDRYQRELEAVNASRVLDHAADALCRERTASVERDHQATRA